MKNCLKYGVFEAFGVIELLHTTAITADEYICNMKYKMIRTISLGLILLFTHPNQWERTKREWHDKYG